jgi:hypothetical protein
MLRRTLVALMALMLTQAVNAAEKPLDPDAFDALTLGRTLGYARPGNTAYGTETYFRDRRVIWSYEGEACKSGYWYPARSGEICFIYPPDETPQCWQFFLENNLLRAQFSNDPTAILYEVKDHPGQTCPGFGS